VESLKTLVEEACWTEPAGAEELEKLFEAAGLEFEVETLFK
jgi:hypothetical protein